MNIEHLQIIDQFISPSQVDIVEATEKPGIISSTSEEHIYLNENLGSLGTVYVEEGQEIQLGEVLFSYHNIQLGSAERELQLKIEQTELRSSQLSDEIFTLNNMKDMLARTTYEDEPELIALLESQIAQYDIQILQKEHQIASLELEKEQYQQSLSTLSEQQAELEITSPVTGIVKEINTNRNEPFLTLLSSPFVAKGELTEMESLAIDEGMNVEIRVHDREPMDGILSQISNFPSKAPNLEQETTYPFVVELSDIETDLKIGYHVNLKIIQNKILDAIVIPPSSIAMNEEQFVVFTAIDGHLVEKGVTLGMVSNNRQQVTYGLSTADLLVDEPYTVSSGQPFVTKVRLSELEREAFSSFRKKELLMLALRGFLQ